MRAAFGLVVVLLLVTGAEARPQDGQPVFTSVEEGIASIRAGDSLTGRVSPGVAHDAVARIDRVTSAAALYELAALAGAGGAQVPLAARLVTLALGDPGALSPTVFDLLRQIPAASLDEALGPSRLAWDTAILELVARDDARAPRALPLLVRDAEPRVLLACLASETTNALRLQLLRDLETTRRPREMLDAFARVELDPALFEPFCSGLSALVAKDEAAAMLALDLAAQGTWGWGSALLRALGSLPPELQERAAPFVLHALETARGYHLAAAVIAATKLRLPELGPQLRDLARAPDSREVRVAAIRAIPVLRHRDPETIDLLIDLLADPEVSKEAHRALLRQAGVRLPLQRQPWLEWRRKELPTDGPVATLSLVPSIAPVVRPPDPTPPPTSTPTSLIVLATVMLCGAPVLLRRAHRRRAKQALVTEEKSAADQAVPPSKPAPSSNTTRLERLGAGLDDILSGAALEESEAQLSVLRRALSESSAGEATVLATEESGGGVEPPPVLPPLDALRELERLARALEGQLPKDCTFEVVRTSVERLERSLPGSGFTELGRECCFLLVQVAFQLSRGRSLEATVKERLLAVLGDLEGHLSKVAKAVDPRTVDVTEVFTASPQPPARAHGVSRSMTTTLDHSTVDVTIAFPESVPLVRPRPPKDAPTLDVTQAFPAAPSSETLE